MTDKKRKPKTAGSRTEVFAMRFDPRLKYLAEIAARKQRRSLANFIEYAVEVALEDVKLVVSTDLDGRQHGRSVLDEASKLWDLEPSDRLIKLAENYPDLMTYEEQVIWKAICEITFIDSYKDDAGKKQVTYLGFLDFVANSSEVNCVVVKQCWPKLVAYAEGNATVEDVIAALKEALFSETISF